MLAQHDSISPHPCTNMIVGYKLQSYLKHKPGGGMLD